jgi:cation diffusion facilitator CzcD-associated flavoprotein CzcO
VWCKRPAFSDTYLQTFNQHNVHLVDTDGKGVSSIAEDGIFIKGREYPLDVLILSTGYRTPVYANGSPAARAGVQVFGRDGLGMDEKWLEQGVATLHGLYTHGFPNLFFVGHAQAGAAANFVLTLDVMASHIAYVIEEAQSRVGRPEFGVVIEVEREAEESWTAECMKRAAWYAGMGGCTPGLATAEGEALAVLDEEDATKKSRASGWSEGMESYIGVLNAWKVDGLLKGLKLSILS